MTGLSAHSFRSCRSRAVAGRTFADYSIQAAEENGLGIEFRLPVSKVLLESVLRFDDDRSVTLDDIDAVTDSAERRSRRCKISSRGLIRTTVGQRRL